MALLSNVSLLKTLDSTFGYTLCKLVGHVRHWFGRPELAPDPDPINVHRLLIIRPGGMGDMLMLLPVVRAVQAARPDMTIDIVCEKRNYEVLTLAGLGEHALLYDATPFRLVRRLIQRRYDVVLDTEQFHNFSAILAWLSGAPVRVGFRINPARLHLYTHLVGYDSQGFEMHQFTRLLQPLGLADVTRDLHGLLADTADDIADRTPADVARLREQRRTVAISPGSSNRYKHWDSARFAEVTKALHERGYGLVLVGGKAEAAQARDLMERCGDTAIVNCVGTLSLTETAAVLSTTALFIGCDSGLAHLATALARPTVVLFGPSDSRKWSSRGNGHVVLSRPLPCAPCASFGYHKLCRDIPCMARITVDQVLTAAISFLPDMSH